MSEKRRLSRLTVINLVLLGLFMGTFLSPLVYSGFRSVLDQTSDAQGIPEADQKAAVALQNAYINVFKKASPSVVFIRTNMVVPPRYWFDLYEQQQGAGTGIVIDAEGYIVTNNHVVVGANKIEVVFSDQTKARATLIGRDETSDIALIKVTNVPTKIIPAVLGDSDKVTPGQLAFALGSPFGLESTFTVGIISAKHRSIDNTKYTRIQTDASINPGNSGGPLLNIYGEVIGINQSIIAPGGQGGSVGIGFAIPINEAKGVISQLKREKRVIGRPTLGVQVGVPTANLKQFLKVEEDYGLVVRFIVPGSAAEDGGLKAQDYLLKANGRELKAPEDLIQEVQKAGVGGKVQLEYIREGKKKTIDLTVGEDQQNR
jgi:serine protease Do